MDSLFWHELRYDLYLAVRRIVISIAVLLCSIVLLIVVGAGIFAALWAVNFILNQH